MSSIRAIEGSIYKKTMFRKGGVCSLMTVERIFDNNSGISADELLNALIEDKIDTIVGAAYSKCTVNSTDSSKSGGEVA